MAMKIHPTIGCCGIDCGLCPRFHTDGKSRCPGCGGEEFEQKHPSCGFVTCCVKKHGKEVCAECEDFPCGKFAKETGEHDSFVTHRRVILNQRLIVEIGIEAFIERQTAQMEFLETALENFDDGRSKNFFCLAAALLSVKGLDSALAAAKQDESLRIALTSIAEDEGQELKLRK